MSNDSNDNTFDQAKKTSRDGSIPMRIASQQHKVTNRLFDNLAADNLSSSDRSSSNNAIEKLNLLEEDEDDDSEWNEPPKTVFDRDAQEESKTNNLLIQHADEQGLSDSDSIE